MLAPVLLLSALEGALRLAGYGYPTGFFRTISANGQKLVVENDEFSRRFFPERLLRRPLPVSFSAAKPEGTYRIFVMGESAAMGDPDPAFAFGRVLKVLLQERFPALRFEVINVAFTAINSHVILPIARDCARQDGDLWIVYMGHNEVQGPFGPGTILGAHRSRLWLVRASLLLKRTKLGQWIQAIQSRRSSRGSAPNTWRGLEMFLQNQLRHDDPRLQSMYAQFERNLEDILRAGRQAGAQVILCSPAANLKDCAPFASLHSTKITPDRKSAWEKLYQQGAEAQSAGQAQIALDRFGKAAAIDPDFAELQFRYGLCSLELHQLEPARQALELASDLDTLRFRTDSRLNDIVQQTATRWRGQGVSFCDTRRELAKSRPDGVPGDDLFFDHVHLTFAGNYLLARTIAQQVSQQLPTDSRKQDTGAWAELDLCARRLGLTEWFQYQMCDVMQRRLLEAPFTNQMNHLARQQRYAEKLATLRPAFRRPALESAVRLCREAISHAPDDPNLHENLAKLLAFMADNNDAVAEFRRVTEIWPQHASAFSNIGLLLQKGGQGSDAEKYFRHALALRPDFADARNGLGLIQAARGDWDAAIATYRRALQDNPELVEALVNLGLAWQTKGRLAQARTCYDEALRTRPGFAPAHLGLADVLLQEGQFFEAIPHLSDAARRQPESTLAHVNRGALLLPNEPIAHFKRANVLAALNQPNQAVESLQTAVRLNTNFWQARYLLGVELANQNKLSEAQNEFAAVIQLRPDYARAHLNLGVALAKQMRLEEAAGQFHQTLRLDPANRTAQEFLLRIQTLANPLPAQGP